MNAGRELDALVAEKVLDYKVEKDQVTRGIFAEKKADDPWDYFLPGTNERVCEYSTDIAAAWDVVRHLQSTGNLIDLLYHPDAEAWSVLIGDRNTNAKTVEMAICLAALKDAELG